MSGGFSERQPSPEQEDPCPGEVRSDRRSQRQIDEALRTQLKIDEAQRASCSALLMLAGDGVPQEAKWKKPLSSYMLWVTARRAEYKAATNGKTIQLIELGAEWTCMSNEDKQVWKDRASAHKEEAGPSAAAKRNAAAAKAKAEAPRKKRSGFFMYMAESRAALKEEVPGIQPQTVMVTLAQRWKRMGKAGQVVWNEKAAAEKGEIEAEAALGKRKAPSGYEEKAEAMEGSKKESKSEVEDNFLPSHHQPSRLGQVDESRCEVSRALKPESGFNGSDSP